MSISIQGTQKRASTATRQVWPADRKIDLVLGGLRGHRPVTQLCREAGISPSRYYQWLQEFIDAARVGLAHPEAEQHALEERIQQLEAENARLRQRAQIFQELCVAD
jgi:transposase-like protein